MARLALCLWMQILTLFGLIVQLPLVVSPRFAVDVTQFESVHLYLDQYTMQLRQGDIKSA